MALLACVLQAPLYESRVWKSTLAERGLEKTAAAGRPNDADSMQPPDFRPARLLHYAPIAQSPIIEWLEAGF
jgi:hypothetical protein